MNSLVRVFSNFREFYSEINGATLTGAIDVIVVEQPDGEFLCSPFHVRFGKLGVLRSREKIVDIEINGEPVDIHMKLGYSGEAFFVEECPEEDIEELPENLATSPIPTIDYLKYDDIKKFDTASDDLSPLPIPRRNSIDVSKECNDENDVKSFENQVSDFKSRRHTDNILERPDLSLKKKEFTTQKIRQEWAELGEEQLFTLDIPESKVIGATSTSTSTSDKAINVTDDKKINEKINLESPKRIVLEKSFNNDDDTKAKEIVQTNVSTNKQDPEKSKKKRRKKSQMKKKNIQRKSSSSSSVSSITAQIESNEPEPDTCSMNNGSSNDDEASSKVDDISTKSIELKTALDSTQIGVDNLTNSSQTTLSSTEKLTSPNLCKDLDIHFFSDTEIQTPNRHELRPSTPIQSDSELEIQQRGEKVNQPDSMSASWKWGELPTTPKEEEQIKNEPQAQRNSMLSGMFSFMKKTNKMRSGKATSPDGGVYLSDLVDSENIDPEMAALYFPSIAKDGSLNNQDDDRESGNGTSLPHSPSSMEGGAKSIDSDYEDNGKQNDPKYLDFISMSMCGGMEKGGPTDEEFEHNIVKYSDVCQDINIFSSPNLVVRLNGKYYSWAAACPIIMTIITFKKPLSNDAVEQLMNVPKDIDISSQSKNLGNMSEEAKPVGYSYWFSWRRSAGAEKNNSKDSDQNAVATQTSRTDSPNSDIEHQNMSLNDELSQNKDLSKNISLDSNKSEKYRKSLRLSSEQIKRLNLKDGMNEIEFSVTTAYQGTSRCKCYLFRWKYNDKVVISDIDGTITKSDVLGHILPMVGKDWAQIGVAQLFSKIEENGYKLLYLSARAIGQSRVTREYLRSIRQGDVKLPDGPLLLNPTSLISAFHREVIEKKPEQFKIACLSDIRELFPDKSPFYAGYGNRINDVWAYRAVGIPIMRIFTINTKGELKHELTQTFQSSYCSMTYIVDQLFPPLRGDEESIFYSNFNYWRDPLPEVELDSEIKSSTLTTIPEN